MLIFLLAGHDTTAIALTFALHLLGRNRDVQARITLLPAAAVPCRLTERSR